MTRPLGKLLHSASGRLFRLAGEAPAIAPVAGMLGMLIAYVAADADDHVANRLIAAQQIRSLLGCARDVMPPDRSARVAVALAWQPSEPSDFRGERIDQYSDSLRRTLIEVHAWLETAEGCVHGALLDDLWTFLKADARQASRLVPTLW